jgi:hypothetical protein
VRLHPDIDALGVRRSARPPGLSKQDFHSADASAWPSPPGR